MELNNPTAPLKTQNLFAWEKSWSWADVSKEANTTGAWQASQTAEKAYERNLRSVAGQVKTLLATAPPTLGDLEGAEKLLRQYADLVTPWAKQSAANMVASVNRKNVQAWSSVANRAGVDMRRLLNGSRIGEAVQTRIAENMRLIRSVVIGAADEVASLVKESMVTGTRAEDLAGSIAHIGEVSDARARVIARTEVSKASTALTLARAETVGSRGYIWRTAKDGDTRSSHRAMEGVFVPWDKPPTLDGMTGHAGEFPNCRCYPEPVVPRETEKGVYKPALPTRAQEEKTGEKQLFTKWEQEPTSRVILHKEDDPLPNVNRAVFLPQKLTHYALDINSTNPKAKSKAVLFKELLGMEKKHAQLLETQIMALLPHLPAVPDKAEKWGEYFNVFVPVTGPNGKTVDVKTSWIYKTNNGKRSTNPQLVTCYIPKESKVRP